MKSIATLLMVLLSLGSFAQVDKKLKKLLGYDVEKLEASDNYERIPKGNYIYHIAETQTGDTTGVSNKGEFLMYDDDIVNRKGELFKLFRLEWVTNVEYQEFMTWVKDSIMLEMIYHNDDPSGNNSISDELIGEMLVHPEVYYDSVNQQYSEFDPSRPFINRELFDFSWRMRGIKDEQIIPLITDLYLRPNERFYQLKEVDERKLWYAYKRDKAFKIFIGSDRDVWAKKSQYPFDLYYNLANYYSREQPSSYMPVLGVTGRQIRAFLDWKEDRLQKSIDEKGLNYRVHISLPTEKEIKLGDTSDCDCKMQYILDGKDMTEQWRISNEEYWEFLSWVQDSILREAIYLNTDPSGKNAIQDEWIGEMLNHEDVYYDEVSQSWTEFDPSQPYINRELFPFDWDFEWKKKIESRQYIPLIEQLFENPEKSLEENGKIDHKDFKPRLYNYKYYWKDLERRSRPGEFEWNENKKIWERKGWIEGRQLDMDGLRYAAKMSSGVKRHKNLGEFIIEERIGLYPGFECRDHNKNCNNEHGNDIYELYGYEKADSVCNPCPDYDKEIAPYDFWMNPEASVKGLTYEQAMSFYNWKYHIHTWWNKTDTRFYDDLVPTPEQFEKVQNGEKIVLGEQKLDFPTPWFRYVIHFYPKR